jgi:RNA polymerase sigma factor FliA
VPTPDNLPGNSATDFDELILGQMPQVKLIANRFYRRLNERLELNDLISAGIIGLLQAVDQFDASRNASLGTYAEVKIRGAILDSIRGLDGIKPRNRRRIKQVQDAIIATQQRLQRNPTDEEISAELNLDLAEYHLWMMELRKVTLTNFEAITSDHEVSLLDAVAGDEEETNPARILERSEFDRILAEGIDVLPPNEKTVLTSYYQKGLKLREIATLMDLHPTRISQLRTQAIVRLRSYLSCKWPKNGDAVPRFGTKTLTSSDTK